MLVKGSQVGGNSGSNTKLTKVYGTGWKSIFEGLGSLFNKNSANSVRRSGAGPGGPPGASGGGGPLVSGHSRSESSSAGVISPGSMPSDTPSENVINPDNLSSGYDPYVEDDWNLIDYLQGLLASQGHENDINREFNSAQAAANRKFQSDEAQIQRDWYESMSNTAYRRAVADMKAAGINPILAYQNGGAASSGTGVAAGSAASYSSSGGDTLSSLLSSAADLVSALTGSSASKTYSTVTNFNKIFKTLKR